ncbi:hypothetical protein CABS01_16611 [Colletotrichum abscissum]|uniref:uncharacterized protein n=1 Tax=Colletotrichum abscissum TaxID=1671311 RepID=UPI0027D649B3|nr:uncharacterized protein CABS01_16611 [Colletotrichum abscissum]KAK1519291.1 hypothetical protein CABS01_16611 [Colletotrichum abscissum]
MEVGLVSIGEQVKESTSGGLTTGLPMLCQDLHLPESQLSRDGLITPTGINTAAMTSLSSQESDFDSDICHYYVNLERAANIALSRIFGVYLKRLENPARVVEAFSHFIDRCVNILQDEDVFSTIDWDYNGDSNYDVEEGRSCPFRKRNPRKFNARDLDSCANRSYKNMTDFMYDSMGDILSRSTESSRQSKPDAGPQDPENGVNIRKVALTSGNMIQTWHQLWGLLFPDDEEIPSPNKRTKALLQGSKYFDSERCKMEESSDMVQISTV